MNLINSFLIFCYLAFFKLALLQAEGLQINPVPDLYPNSDFSENLGAASPLSISSSEKVTRFNEIGATELKLKNGLCVCLKPTDFEEDEVVVRMAALGGFAAIHPNQRASLELAGKVRLESGIGAYNADQLSVLLYDKSAEFSLGIEAFCRSIEGSAGKGEAELLFKLINLVFTEQKFTEHAFDLVLSQAKASVAKRSLDSTRAFDEAFLAVNTQNYSALRPLELSDILRADFNLSRKFYEEAFANPQEFVCVIVGSFDVDEMIKMVEQHLASIPLKKAQFGMNYTYLPKFPSGVVSKQVKCCKHCENTSRLTFPVKAKIDETSIKRLEFICQVLAARLSKTISEFTGVPQKIEVVYEFPFFPLLESPWVTIQFKSEEPTVMALSEKIIAELKSIQTAGPLQSEIDLSLRQQQESDDCWMRENDFWVSTLSNYCLVGLSAEKILKCVTNEGGKDMSQVRKEIEAYLDFNNFTLISSFNAEGDGYF